MNDYLTCDESVNAAFRTLLRMEFWPYTECVDNAIRMLIDDTHAIRRWIILKNVEGVPKDREGYWCGELHLEFRDDENRYSFYGKIIDKITDTIEEFCITFESADVDTEIFNSCSNVEMWEEPWGFLRRVALAIVIKSELPGNYCNSKEKELLPVIRELVNLGYFVGTPKEEYFSFCELKSMANQFGYRKIEELFEKLETIKLENDKLFFTTVKKLIDCLCQHEYEPLWREIYNKLADSQAEYPDKVEAVCDNKLLVHTREEIQKLLESKGYSGTYPDFVKKGELKGIHLVKSYNLSYFAGQEKNVKYFIHCRESLEEPEYLTIQFVSGTSFMKKGEDESDIFGCLFNAKGRRIFNTMCHFIPLCEEDVKKKDDLDTSVNIAVKKAECIKLDEKERKIYYGKMIPGWGHFWNMFLFAGGMYSILMTLAGMLICIVATVAFGLFENISEVFSVLPWGPLFVITWILGGGMMGLVEVLAGRK